MCDFQMKCYILLIFHADSHVVFCPFSFTRSAWSIPLKNCTRNRNLQHLIPSGTQTKRGERISFGIFLFLLLDSLLTCVVRCSILSLSQGPFCEMSSRHLYLAGLQSQLDSTPNKPEEEKQNPMNERESEWIQHNSNSTGRMKRATT